MNADIITNSLAAAIVVKTIIDIVRLYVKSTDTTVPNFVWPIGAIFTGILVCGCLWIANGYLPSTQSIAQWVISGILAAGQAMGVTELQKRVG